MKFQTNVCPLCDKVLQLRMTNGISVFHCPTMTTELDDGQTHYQVEFNSTDEVQRTIIFPYSIDSFTEVSKSKIYKAYNDQDKQKWKLLVEVPMIRITTQTHLLARLDQLIPNDII
jgi:Zn-finger nucleic acid-binding protein